MSGKQGAKEEYKAKEAKEILTPETEKAGDEADGTARAEGKKNENDGERAISDKKRAVDFITDERRKRGIYVEDYVVKILDKEGKVRREVKIDKKHRDVEEEDARKGTWRKDERVRYTMAYRPENSTAFGVMHSIVGELRSGGYTMGYEDGKSKFVYYDMEGNELWEKDDVITQPVFVSADGKRVVLLEGEEDYEDGRRIANKLFVFDEKGRELWAYEIGDADVEPYGRIADNGKYVCIKTRRIGIKYEQAESDFIFFNLENRQVHNIKTKGTFCRIDEEGVGRIYQRSFQEGKAGGKKERIEKIVYEFKF